MGTALRIATGEDADFVISTETETMKGYAVATWGEWRAADAEQRAMGNLLAGRTQVIERDGVPVGVLRVERNAATMELKQIFIRTPHQRRGIGTEVLQRLIEEARVARVRIRLRVLRVNPAQQLYRRLGFSVTSETPEHVYMEHAP